MGEKVVKIVMTGSNGAWASKKTPLSKDPRAGGGRETDRCHRSWRRGTKIPHHKLDFVFDQLMVFSKIRLVAGVSHPNSGIPRVLTGGGERKKSQRMLDTKKKREDTYQELHTPPTEPTGLS